MEDAKVHAGTEGPVAPEDPAEKRKGFFVMFESVIEASPRPHGKPSQEIYLEGRLADNARFIGGLNDEQILNLLKSCEGFRKLVHSIGVSVKVKNGQTKTVGFELQNWGKTSKYESGSRLRADCPADGSEVIITLADAPLSEDDHVPGKFSFEFDQPGELATATVVFYVNDGFDVPDISPEPAVDFESDAYRQMIAKSLLHMGNVHRLQKAIEKAKRGEDVTIAYIGGSITQGAGAKPIHTESYAYQSYRKFKEMFGQNGGDHIHLIKAGVGGTPSQLGIIRYERDVLRDGNVKPDIVVIEFAVNDAGDETKGVCYESLALKALSADNAPAVILLFSVFVNDWNLQDRLSPVGFHYDLSMVSVKDAVVDQFRLTKEEGNIISKRQFFYDIFHPTNDGHRVMADCIAHLFAEAAKAAPVAEDIRLDIPPVIGRDFVNIRLLDRSTDQDIATIEEGSFTETDRDLQMVEMDDNPHPTPQFPHNWMHKPGAGLGNFRMTIRCKSLMGVFKDSGRRDFGKAEVYVDGQLVKTYDPHIINWTHCNAVILFQDEQVGEHVVEIKMAEGDEDKYFTILGFGYTL